MSEPQRPPEPDREVSTPRWVYAVGIVVILLALGFVAMHLAGGGVPVQHGPPR